MMIAFWLSRSTTMSAKMSVRSESSRAAMSCTTTAIECGSSSRTPSSAASRMISAMRSSTDSSVTTPSGYSGGPIGHQREQLVGEHVELLVRERRQRDDRSPVVAQRVDLEQALGDLLAGGGIRLGDDRDLLRAPVAVERLGDAAVAGADLLGRGDAEPDHVDVAEHLLDEVVQPFSQQGARAGGCPGCRR